MRLEKCSLIGLLSQKPKQTRKQTPTKNQIKQNKKPKVLLGMVRVSNPELWMLRWKNLDYNRDWNTLKDFASTNKLLNTVYSLVLFIYKNVFMSFRSVKIYKNAKLICIFF